ncbi:MAG TPA: CPBP family intramembrane glutamic endopeptidase [Streptosporangiaceae bacterium]|nr:CPBP family intramembrane glutamic endopeptidase [Streptosporangiaceae bacterium]
MSASAEPAGSAGPAGSAESADSASWPGPIGRPPRARWWSVQPPPAASRISVRRAYGEVLAVFAAFFAAGIIAGGETLARRYPAPSGSWAVYVPASVTEISMAGLAVAVTVLLSSRRGITPRSLGFGLPRTAKGGVAGGSAFRMGVWAIVALVAGGLITGVLATGKLGQPAHQDYGYLLYATSASLAAGVVEESVVLAFVVTTLRQANRPLPEILIVAVLLRCSYHDYYGPGVAGIAVWAVVFTWLFLRSGSIVPLIVVHFLWDATIFWSQRWHWLVGGRLIGALLLLAAATFTWLAEVSKRNSRPPHARQAAPYTAWPYDQPGRQDGHQDQLHR